MLLTYFSKNWKYSNAPEGKAPFEKVVGLSKYGLFGGIGIGIYDCTLLSQTTGFWQTVNCMSYWVVPITAMCASFASVAYITTNIRGKDGYLNYFLASLSAGAICYKWQKNGPFAYHFTVLLALCSFLKKDSDLNNYKILPLEEIKKQHTTFPIDFTLVKDPRGPRPWER